MRQKKRILYLPVLNDPGELPKDHWAYDEYVRYKDNDGGYCCAVGCMRVFKHVVYMRFTMALPPVSVCLCNECYALLRDAKDASDWLAAFTKKSKARDWPSTVKREDMPP